MTRIVRNGISLLLALVLVLTMTTAFAADIQTTPAGEIPIVPEGTDITLTVGVMQTPMIADYETNYFVKWIEEKSGVKLDFIQIPAETSLDKVKLTLSTNDQESMPDMYLSMAMGPNTVFGASYASRWYDEGMIIPLNDLIEQYGVYTKQAAEVAKGYGYDIMPWTTSPDGNIYALPAFSASLTNSYPNKMWINQGWLAKLGLEMPTTTDAFYEVLKAFKEGDPNGNGQADEIPFTGANQAYARGYETIINSFIYNDTTNSRMYVEEGVVKFAPTTDQWREAMKYLNKLCTEGLLYEGSFTQDMTTLQQMATNENDVLGGFEGLGFDLVMVTDKPEIALRVAQMPALTGPEGAHYVTWAAPGVRPAGIVTTKCKYPEIAFRVLDLMMSDEAAKITRYGEKGVNWDDADEGTVSYYGTPAILKILENTWAKAGQNQNFLQQSPFILDPAVAKGVQWGGNEFEPGYIKARGVMLLDETGVVPEEYLANLVFSVEEIESIATPRNDIDTYILQSIANFTVGQWDPNDDQQWQTYVAEYEKMGLAAYLEAVQAAYSRMMK